MPQRRSLTWRPGAGRLPPSVRIPHPARTFAITDALIRAVYEQRGELLRCPAYSSRHGRSFGWLVHRINGEYWPPEKGARLMIDNHDDSDEIDL